MHVHVDLLRVDLKSEIGEAVTALGQDRRVVLRKVSLHSGKNALRTLSIARCRGGQVTSRSARAEIDLARHS